MTIFQPYKVPANLPPLAPSRVKALERIIRILEGTPNQHIIVDGAVGIGRHTLINQVLSLAPSFGRKQRFILDAGECAAELYEANDVSEFFVELKQFATKHPRALIFIDNPALLIDTHNQTEERRLARMFDELGKRFDLRCILPLERDVATRITTSKTLKSHFSAINLDQLLPAEIDAILTERNVQFPAELLLLATRFFPQEAGPGSTLRLWHSAQQIAAQHQRAVQLSDAHEFISEQRGIPVSAITTNSSSQLRTLGDDIRKELVGQEHAIQTVHKVLTRAHAGFRNQHKPVASFLFLGPSGVGKTELAKILSRLMYNNQRAFHRIDMSEFSESHTAQRLIGAPPGYVGYEEGGQLTNPVSEDPYSLVLLDEIEKAHPKVFDVFLQLLDDGRLTDGRGKTVDFTHTTVVATSNIGLRDIVRSAENGLLHDHEKFLNQIMLPLLIEHFRPEFLNRFDAIIVFEPLQPNVLEEIGRREVQKLIRNLARRKISLQVANDTLHALSLRAYQPTFGARPMKRLIEDNIEAVIAEKLILGELQEGGSVSF